jgi:hypothetical protein
MKYGDCLASVLMLLVRLSLVGAVSDMVKYPPCVFNPLCPCSKAVSDLGIVLCLNVPLPRLPPQMNGSKAFMLHLENNGLRYIEPCTLLGTGKPSNTWKSIDVKGNSVMWEIVNNIESTDTGADILPSGLEIIQHIYLLKFSKYICWNSCQFISEWASQYSSVSGTGWLIFQQRLKSMFIYPYIELIILQQASKLMLGQWRTIGSTYH